MSKKLTPWFPETVKPARKGVYETEIAGRSPLRGYSLWTGKNWSDTCACVETAAANKTHGWPSKKWRGLTKEAA